jgi:hypothetical protein
LIALRISVLPGARKTRTWAGTSIIHAPVPEPHSQGLPGRIPWPSQCGNVGPLQGKAVEKTMMDRLAQI